MNPAKRIFYSTKILLENKFVLILFTTYVSVLTVASILKHYNLHSFAYDLGIFMQSLWNTLHGKFFYETPDLYWNPSGNYLSVHFSLVMFLLIPLYFIFPRAESLFFLQSFVIGLAGFPLYLLAKHITMDEKFSRILVLSYYLSPILHAANLYDFHIEAFIPFLLILSVYYVERGSVFKATLTALLICFCLYTLSPLVILLSIFYSLRMKSINCIILCSVFLVIFYFCIVTHILLPILGNVPFTSGTITWFPYLGKSWEEILRSVFFSPELLIKSIMHDIWLKLTYWGALSTPVVFLNFIYIPILLPLSFWLIISFLTTYTPFYTLGWQYPLIVIPLIYIGSVYGYEKLLNHKSLKQNILRKIKKAILLVSLIQFIILSPILPVVQSLQLQGGGGYDIILSFPPRYYFVKEVFELVGENRTYILTTSNVFPHFANSPNVFVWAPSDFIPDYIVLDVYDFSRLYDVVGNLTFIRQFEKLTSETYYGIYALKGGVLILKLGYNDTPKFYEPMNIEISPNKLSTKILYKATLFEEGIRPVLKGQIIDPSQPAWFGPYMLLPPGNYLLTLHIRTSDSCLKKTFVEITSEFGTRRLMFVNASMNSEFDGGWHIVKFYFNLARLEKHVEVRGWGFEGCEIELGVLRLYGPILLS